MNTKESILPSSVMSLGRRELIDHMARAGMGMVSLAMLCEGFAGKSARAATPDLVTHQLGWVKGVQFGGDFMAQEQGYFAAENLRVEYTAGGISTDYRTLVSAGRTMVSESNVAGMMYGAIEQQPIVAFAAVMQKDPGCFMSNPKKPVASLSDMVGRTIGVPNNIRNQITVLLKRAKIDPATVRFVPIGSDPSMLVVGQVDAYWGWATNSVPALRRVGFDPYILSMADIGIPGYAELLIARRDTLAAQHDLFVRYTRALVKGWQWMVDHTEDCARIVTEKYAAPGTNLADQIAEARMMIDYITAGDAKTEGLLWIKPEPFEQGVKLAQEMGMLTDGRTIDVSQIMTQSVIRSALGK